MRIFIENLNLIIEIKSSYYYKLHEQKNIKKKEATFDNNYNYILIMNKNYDELLKLLEKGKWIFPFYFYIYLKYKI